MPVPKTPLGYKRAGEMVFNFYNLSVHTTFIGLMKIFLSMPFLCKNTEHTSMLLTFHPFDAPIVKSCLILSLLQVSKSLQSLLRYFSLNLIAIKCHFTNFSTFIYFPVFIYWTDIVFSLNLGSSLTIHMRYYSPLDLSISVFDRFIIVWSFQ